jgi:hypothetical protein
LGKKRKTALVTSDITRGRTAEEIGENKGASHILTYDNQNSWDKFSSNRAGELDPDS